jgi:hypothetical protein
MTQRNFGKGRVFRGIDLPTAFAQMKVAPDLSGIDPSKILFIHRSSPDAEIYFICNQSSTPTDLIPTFRVKNKQPELWHADTGRIERPAIYNNVDAGVKLPLHLDSVGSVFVVFKKDQTQAPYVKLLRDDKTVIDATVADQPVIPTPLTNGGTFTLAFWVRPGGNTSLPGETNVGIVGMADPRNEIIFPQHGNTFGPGEANSGVGFSVGTNGVAVYEHGDKYFVPILTHAATLLEWTHVAIVYKNNEPSLFINGKPAHTGIKSPRTAHPSDATTAKPDFIGTCGPIHRFARALTPTAITNQMAKTASEAVDATTNRIEVTQRDNRILILTTTPGTYKLLTQKGRELEFTVSEPPPAIPLTSWTLEFPTNSGIEDPLTLTSLASWTANTNPLVKYFSGTASYKTQFDISSDMSTNQYRLILDLGEIHDLAEVLVNGKTVATLWKPPFRVSLNGLVHRGNNDLEVRVINVWHNRLVGQQKEPSVFTDAGAFLPTVHGAMGCGPNDPLFPSGLIGPACIRPVTQWYHSN